jgi:hypothetical protein
LHKKFESYVSLREELLLASETRLAGSEKHLVDFRIIEARHRAAIETERSGSQKQVATLQSRVPLCCRLHQLRVALEERDHPWVLREQLRQMPRTENSAVLRHKGKKLRDEMASSSFASRTAASSKVSSLSSAPPGVAPPFSATVLILEKKDSGYRGRPEGKRRVLGPVSKPGARVLGRHRLRKNLA